MKTSSKIIRPIVFGLIVFVCFVILSFIFNPKNNSKEAGMYWGTAYGFLGENKNTIDIMFLGDSEAYNSFIPMQIYNEYGYTSYVASNPAQRVYESYILLREVLKKQDLKIVVLEANSIYRNSTPLHSLRGIGKRILPFIIFHNRWKSLSANDFFGKVEYTWTDVNKGYRFRTEIDKSTDLNYMKPDKTTKKIQFDNKFWVEKIKELCDENDIKFVLVKTPSTANWNSPKHNGIERLAKSYDIEFIDLNDDNLVSMDWSHDTYDKGDHINYYGAKKVTAYMADYFHNLNILEDHRNQEGFKSYDDALKPYLNKIKKIESK